MITTIPQLERTTSENEPPAPVPGRAAEVWQKITNRIITLVLVTTLVSLQACDTKKQHGKNEEQIRQEILKISYFLDSKRYEFPGQYSEEGRKRARQLIDTSNEMILFNDPALREMVENGDIQFTVVSDIKKFMEEMTSISPEQKEIILSDPNLDSTNFITASNKNNSTIHRTLHIVLDASLLRSPATLLAIINYHLASLYIASKGEKDGPASNIMSYERSIANLEKILENLKNPNRNLEDEYPQEVRKYERFVADLEQIIRDEKTALEQFKTAGNN